MRSLRGRGGAAAAGLLLVGGAVVTLVQEELRRAAGAQFAAITESWLSAQPLLRLVLLIALLALVSGAGAYLRHGREEDVDEGALTDLEVVVRDLALRRSVGRLKDIVAQQGLLEIAVEGRPRFVHDPVARPDPGYARDVTSAFRDSHGRLLVVGEPASGKTVTAYVLAGVLDRDVDRLPLVVNLSAWADQPTFDRFLVDHLVAPGGYGIPRPAAAAWIATRTHRFGLVLDGLDEVPAAWRPSLLSRLEDWLPFDMPVVLTCRTQEYRELLGQRPRGVGLTRAIELQPLDGAQLDRALRSVTALTDLGWDALLVSEPDDASIAVREALRSPLILNLAVSTRLPAVRLRKAGTDGPEAVRHLVIDDYLEDAFRNDPALRVWTTWVARYLRGEVRGPFETVSHDATAFALSQLTPDHVPRRWPLLATGFAALPVVALTFAGWTLEGVDWPVLETAALAVLSTTVMGLLFWLLLARRLTRAAPTALRLRRPDRASIVRALVWGLAGGILFGAGSDGGQTGTVAVVGYGVLAAAVVGLASLRSSMLAPHDVRVADTPEGPSRSSWRSAALSGPLALVVGWVVTAIVFAPQLAGRGEAAQLPLAGLSQWGVGTLVFAVLVGLHNGGWYLVMQQVAARRLMRELGLAERPIELLARGIEPVRPGTLALLRPVGSAVRFLHNDLRDRLSTIGPESRRSAAASSARLGPPTTHVSPG